MGEEVPEGLTPQQVGKEIRRLLLSLRAPGHKGDEFNNDYHTDELREEALDAAGICFQSSGEMAPFCGCEWKEPEDEVP